MLAEDAEKRYLSYIAGGNIKGYNHFGKYFFKKKNKCKYSIIQQLQFWAGNLEKWTYMSTEKYCMWLSMAASL